MGESISITNVELVVEDVSAKLANVETEVKESSVSLIIGFSNKIRGAFGSSFFVLLVISNIH